jgi:hypothetical protein
MAFWIFSIVQGQGVESRFLCFFPSRQLVLLPKKIFNLAFAVLPRLLSWQRYKTLTAEEGLFDLSCGKKGADLLSCSSPSYRL